MQINGSFQIVTSLHLLYQPFCAALRFLFVSFAWLYCCFCFVRSNALGISLLRERFSGAARPPKNPLASWAQLDQLMGALLLLCHTAAAAAILGFALSWALLNKKT